MPPADDRCRSVRQVAAYFGVAPAKVRAWVKKRLLRATNVGERRVELRISPDAIREFEQRRAATVPVNRQRRGEQIDAEVLKLLEV